MARRVLWYSAHMNHHRDIRALVEELIEKWRDVLDTSDDRTEQTLADEVIDDLKSVIRCLATN